MPVSDPPLKSPLLDGLPNTLSRVWNRFFRDLFVASGSNVGSPFPAGFVSPFMGGTGNVPNGWILADDGTIGSRLSGATNLANDVTRDLYVLIWDTHSDTDAPVTGGRGSSALADFTANKSIKLPLMAGRAIACAGQGSGLTDRDEGATTGTETHTLTGAESGTSGHTHTITDSGHTHTIGDHNHGITDSGHTHGAGSYGGDLRNVGGGGVQNTRARTGETSGTTHNGTQNIRGTSGSSTTGIVVQSASLSPSTESTGITIDNSSASDASSAHNIMQPTVFLNYIIKL